MGRRERIEAGLFHALAALGTLAWWLWLWRDGSARPHFFGLRFAEQWPHLFMPADLLALVAGGAWLAWAILRRRPEASALAWVHLGACGYAFLLTATLAVGDARAYWGFVAMAALAAGSFLVALRLNEVSLLRGPFRPRRGPLRDERDCRRATLRQTALMWLVFFGFIPGLLALVEHLLGWSAHWIDGPARLVAGSLIFSAGGALALWAGNRMARDGRGTPLPAVSARELVVTGPYRWVRNPMALGSLAQGIALALLIGSPLVLVYALSGIMAWELLVRHEEERFLATTFGEDYARYRTRVRCWWPRFDQG